MAAAQPRLGRLERAALQGVMVREVVNYSSFWRSSTFSSTVDPTIYLLAFGFGFGSLVSTVAGYDYIDFVGTGIVATTVLFSGAFPAMYSTFVKYEFQHTYERLRQGMSRTDDLPARFTQAASGAIWFEQTITPAGGRRIVITGERISNATVSCNPK